MSRDTIQQAGPDGRVADAVSDNWVDRAAPAATRPYLRLSRIDRPIGTWLLLLPCWWGIALAAMADPRGFGLYDAWLVWGCAIGAFLMRGAGCTWNDLADRDFDGSVARTMSRPLPSGQVTPMQAVIWMCVQALLAFGILLTFPLPAIGLGIASLALVAIYPFAKRFTWWPQVFLGLAFNWGAVLGWAAHGNPLGWAPVALYAGAILWTLFYDTIYAHQDREDDALIGIKSTARLFGDASGPWLLAFLVGSVLLIATAVLFAADATVSRVVGLAGVAVFAGHLLWQWWRLDVNDTTNCLTLFRSNRDAGLALATALALAAIL